jgi:lipopolysaccharide export system permease protein
MGFETLAANARDRREQLEGVRDESRHAAILAVKLALSQPVDSAEAEALAGTPTQISRLRLAQAIPDRDRMTQQTVTSARSRAARGVALEQTVNRFEVEIHKKLALAFACIVFTRVGLVVTASSVIFFVYWVGLILGESLAERRVASPVVTMWMTNVIFLVAGLVMLAQMGRTGGGARTGGQGLLGFFGRGEEPGEPAPEAAS